MARIRETPSWTRTPSGDGTEPSPSPLPSKLCVHPVRNTRPGSNSSAAAASPSSAGAVTTQTASPTS